MPATFYLALYQGDTYNLPITLTYSDTNATPIDISGWVFSSEIRDYPGSPYLIGSFTITVIDAPTGKINLSLSPAQTMTLPHNCAYDVTVTKPDSTVETILYGRIAVVKQV
jgi:hypothetical protein